MELVVVRTWSEARGSPGNENLNVRWTEGEEYLCTLSLAVGMSWNWHSLSPASQDSLRNDWNQVKNFTALSGTQCDSGGLGEEVSPDCTGSSWQLGEGSCFPGVSLLCSAALRGRDQRWLECFRMETSRIGQAAMWGLINSWELMTCRLALLLQALLICFVAREPGLSILPSASWWLLRTMLDLDLELVPGPVEKLPFLGSPGMGWELGQRSLWRVQILLSRSDDHSWAF